MRWCVSWYLFSLDFFERRLQAGLVKMITEIEGNFAGKGNFSKALQFLLPAAPLDR